VGTRIEAIIFDGDPETAALPEGLRAVPLPCDLTMLPVTAEVASGLDPDEIGDERIPGNWNLQQPVAALARALSHDRRVVYFFSETWAGPGIKESIAWRAGHLLCGPSGTCDKAVGRFHAVIVTKGRGPGRSQSSCAAWFRCLPEDGRPSR
jgi:hypothetical protein